MSHEHTLLSNARRATRRARGLGLLIALSAGCGSGTPGAPPGTIMASLNFSASQNGFAFGNYTNTISPREQATNLTAAEVQRLFGDSVCACTDPNKSPSCTLTPAMDMWRQEQNARLNGGHCEGMAILSLLFFTGQRRLSDYGVSKITDLQLEGNLPLQRELAYWWATQAAETVNDAEVKGGPGAVVDGLAQLLRAGPTADTATLAFCKPGLADCHAVAPYAIVDKGGGVYGIKVYDNNYPLDDTRQIQVDRNLNTWFYSTAANPANDPTAYVGDVTTRLGIRPVSARLDTFPCPSCGAASVSGPQQGAPLKIFANGDGYLLIDNLKGGNLGILNDQIVNTIPNGMVDILSNAARAAPTLEYQVPARSAYSLQLSGANMTEPSQSDILAAVPGYAVRVSNINLRPGETQSLLIGELMNTFVYTTPSQQTPTLELGFQDPDGTSWQIAAIATSPQNGVRVTMRNDLQNHYLTLSLDNTQGPFAFAVQRSDKAKNVCNQLFRRRDLTLEAGRSVRFRYGEWPGTGPMTADVISRADDSVVATVQLDHGG